MSGPRHRCCGGIIQHMPACPQPIEPSSCDSPDLAAIRKSVEWRAQNCASTAAQDDAEDLLSMVDELTRALDVQRDVLNECRNGRDDLRAKLADQMRFVADLVGKAHTLEAKLADAEKTLDIHYRKAVAEYQRAEAAEARVRELENR